jgi:adenine phosphoribosyltransferase
MIIKSLIRTIPHYPKAGVMFRDITTLLKDPVGFKTTIDTLAKRYDRRRIDKVAAIESRGFIIGAAAALALGTGIAIVRKPGKLPYRTHQASYQLEYGSDTLEIHHDAIGAGHRVLLIDDLLATGGTASAAIQLVEQCGGRVAACAFVIELGFLDGRARLAPHEVHSLIRY